MQGEVKQVVLDKAGDLYLNVEIVDNTVADNKQDPPFTFDTEQAKKAVMMDLVNKPYVLTKNLYHPDWTQLDPENTLSDSDWLKKYFQWQEDFAIGRVRKVFEAGKGVWNSWLHITNKVAKEAYLKGKIPKSVSIGFFSPEYRVVNGIKRITRGIALHVAAVVAPAWKNAYVRSECIGNDSCMREMNQAGIPSCSFCIETVLNSLKPDQCFSGKTDSNSISQKPIFQGSSMKLSLEDLKSLTDEEKKKLMKALSGEGEPEPAQPVEPEEESEEETETEKAKLKAKAAVKGAPIQPPAPSPTPAPTDAQSETTDDKMTILKLQKQVTELLNKDVQRDKKSQEEDQERKMGVIEQFTANESDEALKKTVIEKAMALPSIEDVKFWLSLKYAQAIEMTTPTRRGKVGHAGIHEYIDTRAVTRPKTNPVAEFSSSVFAFGED